MLSAPRSTWPCIAIDAQIAPSLQHDATSITRVKDEAILQRQTGAPVTVEFQPERAALQGVHTLEQNHQIELKNGRLSGDGSSWLQFIPRRRLVSHVSQPRDEFQRKLVLQVQAANGISRLATPPATAAPFRASCHS